jgi:hypothetical protein|tara:strand:+ start:257 stop:568 length:312 start_codon:yes stop_codon:yes gene_type:complete
MRKIEAQMIEAIKANKNWKGGNTEVHIMHDGPYETRANIYLHGNHIAVIHQDSRFGWFPTRDAIPIRPTFRDWPTSTTRSRLRALGINASIKNFAAQIDGEDI